MSAARANPQEHDPAVFLVQRVRDLVERFQARIGSIKARFKHFAVWKKIDDESEPGLIQP
jgi:hypothetical protein